MQKLILLILMFMYLFAFNMPIASSSVYSSFIASIFCFFNIKKLTESYKFELFKEFIYKQFKYIIFPLFFLFVICSFIGVVHGTNDFSYTTQIFKSLIYSVLFVPVAGFFITGYGEGNRFKNFLYQPYLIQSTIIILCLLFPSLYNIVKSFQYDSIVEVAERYNGIRGLALSGPQFFGLACSYIFVMFMLAHDFVSNRIGIKYTLVCFLFFFISSLSIGRTALIGCVIFILYISLYNILTRFSFNKKTGVFFIALTLSALFLFPYMMYNQAVYDIVFNKVTPFAFEFIDKYISTGKFSTTSTDVLGHMYFPLSESTLLHGDGYYTNINNDAYYMNTDAGFMRPTLYGGIFFMLLISGGWCLLLFRIFGPTYGKLFSFLCVVFTLMLQIKGEVMVVQTAVILILSPMILFNVLFTSKKSSL